MDVFFGAISEKFRCMHKLHGFSRSKCPPLTSDELLSQRVFETCFGFDQGIELFHYLIPSAKYIRDSSLFSKRRHTKQLIRDVLLANVKQCGLETMRLPLDLVGCSSQRKI